MRLSVLGFSSLFRPIPAKQSLVSLTLLLLFFSFFVVAFYDFNYSAVISFSLSAVSIALL